MGLLDWFRRKGRQPPSTNVTTTPPQEENSWLRKPSILSFEDLFAEAFSHVMIGFEASASTKSGLCSVVRKTVNSGYWKQRQQVYDFLHKKKWQWNDFIVWQEYFNNLGQWPVVWFGDNRDEMSREAILTRCPIEGISPAEIARVLDKKSLRILLSECGVTFDPKEKVAQLREKIRTIPLETLVNDTSGCEFDMALAKIQDDLQWAMCGILGHTITMRFYKLKRDASAGGISPREYRPFETTCPVELLFGQKWEKEELVGIPPFFPGDRTSFLLRSVT